MKMGYMYGTGRQKDSRGFMIFLIILSFILLCREIIKSGYLLYVVIIIVLLLVVGFIYRKILKVRNGRPAFLGTEFEKKYPIIIQYTPPSGINPAEAGLLYNLKVDITDLTSLIYWWKFEGIIDVATFTGKNSKKEFIKLIKLDEIPFSCPSFESEIFDSIFSMGDIKIIEESFQLRYALMLEDLEYHGIRKGWIVRSELSKIWKHAYDIVVGLLFLCVLLVLFDAFIIFNTLLWIVLGVLLLSSIVLSGYISEGGKLKFTDKGAELASQVIGYRNFIKSCDEDMIKMMLEKDSLFIDRTLPYATAFGMETEFLTRITPLKKDRNAKYVRGKKISIFARVLRMLIGSRDDSWF